MVMKFEWVSGMNTPWNMIKSVKYRFIASFLIITYGIFQTEESIIVV